MTRKRQGRQSKPEEVLETDVDRDLPKEF